MTSGAAWFIWSLLLHTVFGIHADAEHLRAAARSEGIPEIVMEAVAAVESGYSGGNTWRGTRGEIGRMQIQLRTALRAGCPAPIRLLEYEYNIACGAMILRWCRERYPDWARAVRCYQGSTVPQSTTDYRVKVEREIGRIIIARLDQPGHPTPDLPSLPGAPGDTASPIRRAASPVAP